MFGTLREIREIRLEGKLARIAVERLAVPVRDLVLYDDEPPTGGGGLAHYTSWENLLRMLGGGEAEGHPVLRMYNYESANDPEEGLNMPREWGSVKRATDPLRNQYRQQQAGSGARAGSTYGCSFSTNERGVEDDLMLWRLYGDDGRGASLKLGVAPQGSQRIYRVRYRGGRRKAGEGAEDRAVAECLRRLLGIGREVIEGAATKDKEAVGWVIADMLQRVLDGYRHLVKGRAYEHEQEWRMIRVAPSQGDVSYDVRGGVVRRYIIGGKVKDLFLSASKITLGPRVRNDCGVAKEYVKHLLKRHGMNNRIEVAVSKKPYR